MEDYDFIKKFSKITIKKVCDDNNINDSNIWTGRASKKKLHIVRTSIESEIAKLYIKD